MCLFEGITDYDYASIKKIELLKGGRNKQRPYVASGWLNNETKVVIKALVRSTNSVEDIVHIENYSRELGIGAKNRHPNLLSSMGGCFERRLIIIEYQVNRSLKEYFQKHTLTDAERISVAIEITKGMIYLSSKNIVHRDLAARNVFVGETIFDIKIGDFGLSQHLGNIDHYVVTKKNFDMRVTAPEAMFLGTELKPIINGIFTHSADVWSFGVLLWELYTNGEAPYAEISCDESGENFHELLKDGYRLQYPPSSPEIINDWMGRCWAKEPKDRPSFKEIHAFLSQIPPVKAVRPSLFNLSSLPIRHDGVSTLDTFKIEEPNVDDKSWRVPVNVIQKAKWIKNGRELRDCNVEIHNDSGRAITGLVIEPKTEVIQCWNLDKMNDGRFRTQDWMIIHDGGSCEAAGFICVGESRPFVVDFNQVDVEIDEKSCIEGDTRVGITIDCIKNQEFIDKGQPIYNYTLKVTNNTGRTVSEILLEPNVGIRGEWGMKKVEENKYLTNEDVMINNGCSTYAFGCMTLGHPKPRLISFKSFDTFIK